MRDVVPGGEEADEGSAFEGGLVAEGAEEGGVLFLQGSEDGGDGDRRWDAEREVTRRVGKCGKRRGEGDLSHGKVRSEMRFL